MKFSLVYMSFLFPWDNPEFVIELLVDLTVLCHALTYFCCLSRFEVP